LPPQPLLPFFLGAKQRPQELAEVFTYSFSVCLFFPVYRMALPLSLNPSYHAYTRGCEAAEEQSLELIFKLSQCLDGHYPADLLVFMLRELNPRVVLEADPETGRRDWPWLNDRDLDAVERACRYYANTPVPTHERELLELVATLAPLTILAPIATLVPLTTLDPVPTHSREELCTLANAQAVDLLWHHSLSPGKYC
jgi:hypothetical protein